MSRDHLVPGPFKIDASQFQDSEAVLVDVGAAGAAAGAVAVPVTALTGDIPAGTILDFGADKFVRLSADADAGDVSLAVDAIPTALVDADVAYYSPGGVRKHIPSGTVVGRTVAERDSGDGFGPAVNTDDEIFLTALDVTDALENDDVELYRPNSQVYENYLPGWAGVAANVQAIVRERYLCTIAHE